MMLSSAPNDTIRRSVSLRPDLLCFDIGGRVTTADMEWMAKEFEGAFERFSEIDMLVIMRNFDGAQAGTLLDLTVLKAQLRSLGKVRRYAVVGAPALFRIMIEPFDWIVPVDAKTFDLADEHKARSWVEEAS